MGQDNGGLSWLMRRLEEENAEPLDCEIEQLILKRQEARKNRDFALSDKIRDDLLARGIQIIDSPDGPKWKKKLNFPVTNFVEPCFNVKG